MNTKKLSCFPGDEFDIPIICCRPAITKIRVKITKSHVKIHLQKLFTSIFLAMRKDGKFSK